MLILKFLPQKVYSYSPPKEKKKLKGGAVVHSINSSNHPMLWIPKDFHKKEKKLESLYIWPCFHLFMKVLLGILN